MAWEGIFNVLQWADPVYTPDQVAIWPISKNESTQLGASTEACLNTLPTTSKKKLEKWLNKNLPLVMLTVTVASVAGPRAKYSLDTKKVQRANARAIETAARRSAQSGSPAASPTISAANSGVVESGAAHDSGAIDESLILSS